MTETTTPNLRQAIAAALSRAGSFCGECGFQPGETGCPDCRRHWAMCADELLPVITAEVSTALTAAADELQQYIDTEWAGPDRKKARRLWWQPRVDAIRRRAA